MFGVNIISYKKIQYNFLIGGGGTLVVSPEFSYNVGFDDKLKNNIGFSYNVISEQNIKYEINKKVFLNASIVYRLSKINVKFKKDLVGEYIFFDFWQHTLSTKFGVVFVLF